MGMIEVACHSNSENEMFCGAHDGEAQRRLANLCWRFSSAPLVVVDVLRAGVESMRASPLQTSRFGEQRQRVGQAAGRKWRAYVCACDCSNFTTEHKGRQGNVQRRVLQMKQVPLLNKGKAMLSQTIGGNNATGTPHPRA